MHVHTDATDGRDDIEHMARGAAAAGLSYLAITDHSKALAMANGLDERGVSSALGVLRDLGFVTGEGHGAYRRLTFVAGTGKVELESSARYSEGLDEIAEFAEFKAWALTAEPDELLSRFNRPILPTS